MIARDRVGADRAASGTRPSGAPARAEQLLERERALRHVRRVLEQADVAGHQRRRGEADHLPEREVPRHHRQHRRRAAGSERTLASRPLGLDGSSAQEALGVLGVVAAGGGALLGLLATAAPIELAHLGGHQRPRTPRFSAFRISPRASATRARARRTGRRLQVRERGRGRRQLLLDAAAPCGSNDAQPLAGRGIDTFDGHGPNVYRARRGTARPAGQRGDLADTQTGRCSEAAQSSPRSSRAAGSGRCRALLPSAAGDGQMRRCVSERPDRASQRDAEGQRAVDDAACLTALGGGDVSHFGASAEKLHDTPCRSRTRRCRPRTTRPAAAASRTCCWSRCKQSFARHGATSLHGAPAPHRRRRTSSLAQTRPCCAAFVDGAGAAGGTRAARTRRSRRRSSGSACSCTASSTAAARRSTCSPA